MKMSKLDTKFQMLLTEISCKLDTEDVKSIQFMLYKGEIPHQELDEAKSGEDLFKLMLKYGLLSKSNTDFLIKLLEAKNLKPCVDKIFEFTQSNSEELEEPEEGPCNIQREMIVEHFLETSKLVELTQKMEEYDFASLTGILGSGKSQLALKFGFNFHKDNNHGLCWRVACQDEITLLNSLKKLANAIGLTDESKQLEKTPNTESLDSLRTLILKQLTRFSEFKNLVILDDVFEEKKSFCKRLKTGLVEKNVKVLVTTWDPSFCDECCRIHVSGFSEKEAVSFLRQNKELKSDSECESYHYLAEQLGYHPILLYSALTCMTASHLTPRKFIKYLKGINKNSEEMDKLVGLGSESDSKKKLFSTIIFYLNILKEDEGQEVFDMVLALQFLALEEIPVLIFDFFPTDDGQRHQVFHTTNFIQAIQRFSFGFLRGEDDERFITTHLAVVRAIEMITTPQDKKRLLKKILTALMWLMDKDNSNTKDYNRNSILLPHAIKVLKCVQIVKKKVPEIQMDFELNILLTYVNDIVGYTYNFFGILRNAGEHSTAAKESCFTILGVKETDVESQIEKQSERDNHFKSWETFAEYEADIIFEKMKKVVVCEDQLKVLCKMAKNMLLNKYRGQDHITLLQDLLGDDLEEEYILSEDEYEKLCDKHLAMPEDKLGPAFFYELLLQVFYTFGRRVFYLGDAFDKDVARKFTHYLFLAHSLGKRIAEEFPEWRILYVMLTKLSGILELGFDDKAEIKLKTVENLENAVIQFKELLEDTSENLIFGIIKSISVTADQHQHICCKRLVRCFTAMIDVVEDNVKRNEIKKEAKFYQDKLEETKNNCRHAASANVRSAELSLRTGDYDNAINKFKAVCPEDIIETDEKMKNEPFSHLELQAMKGIIECFVKKGDLDQARALAKRTRFRLAFAKETEQLNQFIKFTSKLGIDQNHGVSDCEVLYNRT